VIEFREEQLSFNAQLRLDEKELLSSLLEQLKLDRQILLWILAEVVDQFHTFG
jgi:hypothetical protein